MIKLLCISILTLVVGCGSDHKDTYYSPPALVLDVLDCNVGIGHLDRRKICRVKMRWVYSGQVNYTKVLGDVQVGQFIHQKCFTGGCEPLYTVYNRGV